MFIINMLNFNSRAQGTIEYLVILAVIVVISLVIVGLVTGLFSSPSQQISTSGNQLGLTSQAIGITESLIDPNDGNFVIRLLNNSGENITISNVSVGDTNVLFSEDLAQGVERFFVLSTEDVCVEGKVVSEDVVVTYVTRDGLTKVERYPIKVMFNCTPYVVNVNLVADQCPTCSGITPDGNAVASKVLSGYSFYGTGTTKLNGSLWIGSYLHSGQITSYDTGTLDDKEKDGTAKSYTDNGNGTVTDNHTGLVWMKNHKDNCATLSWQSALSYCSTLASGSGGLTDGSVSGDWRVPSALELFTLSDISYPSSSYLNSVFTQTGWASTCYGYWSSTTVPSLTSFAYFLNSGDGSSSYDDKTIGYNVGVRCVRSP